MMKTFAYLLVGQQVLKHHGKQLKKSYCILTYDWINQAAYNIFVLPYLHCQIRVFNKVLGVGGKSFGVGGEGKNSRHRCDFRVPKAQVTREVQGHASWKMFEIWAS